MNKEIPKIYDPKSVEKKWQDFWEKEKIYDFDRGSEKPIFSVDTPPPYISADSLHVGHAMSYTQAEIIIRYHRMLGENIFYPMGFDDNGLPTERFVEKKYKIDKSKITRKEFVELCLKETAEGGKLYEKLWRSLGLSVDWSLLYSTINPLAQKIAQRSFIDLYNKKRIYREESPTFWCPRCQTALAQADLEDKEEKSYLYDIKFSFEDGKEAIISTTRPELIPACVALYANPKDARYKTYIGKNAISPLTGDKIPVKVSPAVEMEKGTGLMMVCTWGDVEDIAKWREDKLNTKLVMGKNGKLNEKAGEFSGLTLTQAREQILKGLEDKKLLVGKKEISHILNVHERCKNPVEFFISPQWFIKILDIKNDLKERGKELKWHPQFMKVHLDNWIDGLKWDWCISRDRFFGVPFPVWHCEDCGEIILPADGELPVDPRENLPKNKKCPKCKSAGRRTKIRGELQVMDTWMTSSVTPLINTRWKEKESLMKKIYPMSLRVQAFEIIRTWLFYTLAKSHLHTGTLPWENVMISGWGLAKDGEKMSKSLNNFVSAQSVIEKYGADALRYWSCGATLGMNLRWSEEDVKAGKKLLTKIWNVSRFIVMNLEDYDRKTLIARDDLAEADKWILSKLYGLIQDVNDALDKYDFGRAKLYLEHFFWTKLADNYIELVKGRLYGSDNKGKTSAQFTLYSIFMILNKLFAPFFPHIAEELYQSFIKEKNSPVSIHISNWPKDPDFEPIYNKDTQWKINQAEMNENGRLLIGTIEFMRKEKTEKNIRLYESIGNVIITVPGNNSDFFERISDDLKNLAHAKKVKIETSNKLGIKIEI
jgi:valyl-tRNA synthetase